MIFYGTNSSRLKHGQLPNVQCPNCENQTSMTYTVFGKYAYIYWIPIFPTGKVNVLECNHCKRTYKLKELPQHIQSKFETEKHSGVPILHFSGLFIILVGLAFLVYIGSKDNEQDLEFINAPKVGDVYSFKSEYSGNYTTMKVTAVTDDSLGIVINDYEIDKKYRTSQIDKEANYTTEAYGYSKQEIKDLFEDGTIYEVDRD